jgi:F420-non-reducing hydrogenase small subunit
MNRIAFYLASGCSGCEMSFLDLSERLLDVMDGLEVVWAAPLLMDSKYHDLAELEDRYIDVAFIEGGIKLDEQEEIVRLLRKKSKVLVAFGVCATSGGIPGLSNFHSREEVFETVYRKSVTVDNPDGVYPQTTTLLNGKYELTLPTFYERVVPIDRIVEVDYYVGGCPPHYDHVAKVLEVLKKEPPEKGSWITSGRAVCDVCPRNPVPKGEKIKMMDSVKRVLEIPSDDSCLLEQGFLCFGPASQGDCRAACINVNMSCRGCGGPMPSAGDYGAKVIDFISSLIEKDGVVDEISRAYPSLARLIYAYTLPSALIPGRVRKYHVREVD